MKKIIIKIAVLLLFTINGSLITVYAQAPHAFKYQAVARDNAGNIIANTLIHFRISIHKGSPTGTTVYQETHTYTTSQFGLANLQIGMGTVVSGVFSTINWGNDEYFVQVEMYPAGQTTYVDMGTSQLLSVPYALYSEKTGSDGLWTQSVDNIYNANIGKVGIGTTSPIYKLDVDGDFGVTCALMKGTWRSIQWRNSIVSNNWDIIIGSNTTNQRWAIYNQDRNQYDFFIKGSNGYIGLGTVNPTYKLSVNGTIRAKEIIVNTGWSDFVFDRDYGLMSLTELEKYINKNKHLPDIPSAKEVEESGVALGDINSKLLQKIEELTLYVIEQNKKIEKLEQQLNNQKINK